MLETTQRLVLTPDSVRERDREFAAAALPLMPDPTFTEDDRSEFGTPSKKHSATSTIRRFVAEWPTC